MTRFGIPVRGIECELLATNPLHCGSRATTCAGAENFQPRVRLDPRAAHPAGWGAAMQRPSPDAWPWGAATWLPTAAATARQPGPAAASPGPAQRPSTQESGL